MSSAEEIKVELEALSEFRYQLQLLQEKIDPAISKAQYAVQEETTRLDTIYEQRQRNVDACQSSLNDCMNTVDDEGRHPSCAAELSALRQAQQALQEIKTHIASFKAQAEKKLEEMTRSRQSILKSIDDSSQYLNNHIQQTLLYLKGNDIALPATTGQDSHGSAYQRARRRWYREAAAGDFENEPSHLRGWMRQEVNARGYYASPDGYDVGHYMRNLNIPENFRWEAAEMNRGRAARAMQRYPHINNF